MKSSAYLTYLSLLEVSVHRCEDGHHESGFVYLFESVNKHFSFYIICRLF